MKVRGKTKEQLLRELKTLQGRLAKLERAETKRKEALQKSEILLSSIIDQSPFSTWIADANGTNIKQNAACRKLFGIESDEQTVGKYNILSDTVAKEQGYMEEIEGVFKEIRKALDL